MISGTKSSWFAIKQAILYCELHEVLGAMSHSSLMSAIMKDDFDEFSFSDYYRLQNEERALKRAETEEFL